MHPKLTPEQQIIVDKWEQEDKERQKLIDQLSDISDDNSFNIILEKISALTPDCCEHGKPIMIDCMACENIERIIHPELFEDD